ncbi:hypothetical protein [Marivirga sp.]|nr:hypothetical protein [Marivirga sp.]
MALAGSSIIACPTTGGLPRFFAYFFINGKSMNDKARNKIQKLATNA